MRELPIIVVLFFVSPVVYGDEPSDFEQACRERETLLERIAKAAEHDCGLGIIDGTEVDGAKLALHELGRDHAPDRSRRKEFQMRIVEFWEAGVDRAGRLVQSNIFREEHSELVATADWASVLREVGRSSVREDPPKNGARQNGAGQPAAPREGKSEGDEEAHPETEGCSG